MLTTQTFRILSTITFLFLVACPAALGNHNKPHAKGLTSMHSLMRDATDRAKFVEIDFMRWIRWIGTLRHSLFSIAINNIFPSFVIVVSPVPGRGDFTSVQAAVNSVWDYNIFRVLIEIHAGTYDEKVTIPNIKPFITFQGAGSTTTCIEWNDTADTIGPGNQPFGTFSSATVAVNAPYFIAKNITFKNSAIPPRPGAVRKQGVALRVSADTAAFLGCRFLGSQDTLYDHQGRHYFKECYIEGSVDFIFGDGLSLYEGCELHAIALPYGALTAQRRASVTEDTGFSFVNCRVTGSGVLYLGRAWGNFSRVVYSYTYMDNIIVPEGWYNWGDPKREQTVFYGEYKCYGPGASYKGRVAWSHDLSYVEARPFLSLSYIDGDEWISF